MTQVIIIITPRHNNHNNNFHANDHNKKDNNCNINNGNDTLEWVVWMTDNDVRNLDIMTIEVNSHFTVLMIVLWKWNKTIILSITN